jgi:hypothetical protein
VTPLTWLGIAFITVGLTLKMLSAMGLVPGDVGAVSEIYGIGMALLGKELWPGSPQSLAVKARTSKMPPPIAIVLACIGLAALSSCAATPTPREALEGARRAEQSLDRMCEELARTKAMREEVGDALDPERDREAVGPGDAPTAESAEEPAQPASAAAP